MTGLRNRRFLTQQIGGDVVRALRRYEGRGQTGSMSAENADLLFFIVDIDHFKRVNDQHGHAAGDAVLAQIRARLERVFRSTDYLVRWGGEEFLMVARDADRAHAAELAERVRHEVHSEAFRLDDGSLLACSCSLGAASFPLSQAHPQAMDWNDCLKLADAALYAAKNRGRNAWAGVTGAAAVPEAELLQPRSAQEWLASGQLQVLNS